MNEENKVPSTKPEEDRKTQKQSQQSVIRYITVLFGTALVLLLFTFAMEVRQHRQAISESQEEISDLKENNYSASERLQDVLDENEFLRNKLEKSEQTEKALEEVRGQAAQLERSVRAMDWFWQINEAFTKGRLGYAGQLIEKLEAEGLQESLPRESITDNGRFAPYDRYLEIKEKLA